MTTGVEFEEDKSSYGGRPRVAPSSGMSGPTGEERGMIGWLIRHGMAKSSSAAQIVLIGILILNIVLIFLVVRYLL